MSDFNFADLVEGQTYLLTGVDQGMRDTEPSYGYSKNVSYMRLILDGVVYEAVEDPGDDYRSSLDSFSRVEAEVKNVFPAQEVVATLDTGENNRYSYYQKDYILELRNPRTNRIILLVGTSNIDDYYPSYVQAFYPQELDANAGHGNGGE